MAKYVLLRFDEDAEADNFVKQFQDMHVFVPTETDGVNFIGSYEYVGARSASVVRGVYKCPTKFHDPKTCRAGRNIGFTRGQKYGWMVCTACSKPTEGWAKGDGWFTALGRNLLPLSDMAPEYRGIGVPGKFWNEETRTWDPYIDPAPTPMTAEQARRQERAQG